MTGCVPSTYVLILINVDTVIGYVIVITGANTSKEITYTWNC